MKFKKVFSMFISLLLILIISLPPDGIVSAAVAYNTLSGDYHIINVSSGKYLNNYGGDYDGARVTASNGDGTLEQEWTISVYSGFKHIIRSHNGSATRVLDAKCSSLSDVKPGVITHMWSQTPYDSKHWYFESLGGDLYVIRNALNEAYVLAVATNEHRSDVVLQPYTNTAMQKWKLVSLAAPQPTLPTPAPPTSTPSTPSPPLPIPTSTPAPPPPTPIPMLPVPTTSPATGTNDTQDNLNNPQIAITSPSQTPITFDDGTISPSNENQYNQYGQENEQNEYLEPSFEYTDEIPYQNGEMLNPEDYYLYPDGDAQYDDLFDPNNFSNQNNNPSDSEHEYNRHIIINQSGSSSDTFPKQYEYDYRFTDIYYEDWFYYNVVSAYEFGLMRGVSASEFDPDGEVTLAMTITIAARLNSIYYNGYDTIQPYDGGGGAWYEPYVDYAILYNIIDERIVTDRTATRRDFALIMSRVFPDGAFNEINMIDDGAIPDVPFEDSILGAAVYKLYRAGILVGNEHHMYEADSSITRSETSAIVSRMADPPMRVPLTLI